MPERDDAAQQDAQGPTGRDETPAEKLDRNWDELLQELRVTQTGVQILSGFLLTLPFQQRFTRLDPFERGAYLTAVLLAATATALLIAPVSSHRLLFGKHEKDVLVAAGNRMAKAGLVALGLAVGTVILLVFDVVVGRAAALAVAAGVLLLFLVLWVLVPLSMLRAARRRPGG